MCWHTWKLIWLTFFNSTWVFTHNYWQYQIIKLAREYDEKYFDEQKKEIIDSANNSIEDSKWEIANYKTYNVETDQQKYEVEQNIQFEEDNIQKQNQLLQAIKEVTYEDALKLYSTFPLEAEVETDSSGNNIASEKLTLLSYNIREEDNGSRYTIVSNVINSNLESPIIGEIYDRTYKGFRYSNDEFLITSSLDKSVNLGFDTLDTKNVTEE